MMNNNDWRRLFRECRRGDNRALGPLLDELRAYLKAKAHDRLGDDIRRRVDESDIVQNTWLDACRSFSQFSGDDPERFRSWLVTILEYNVRDAIRRHRNTQSRSVSKEQHAALTVNMVDPKSTGDSVLGSVIRGESTAKLHAALESIPERERKFVTMIFFDEYTFKKTADILGCTVSTVFRVLDRGINRLNRLLDE